MQWEGMHASEILHVACTRCTTTEMMHIHGCTCTGTQSSTRTSARSAHHRDPSVWVRVCVRVTCAHSGCTTTVDADGVVHREMSSTSACVHVSAYAVCTTTVHMHSVQWVCGRDIHCMYIRVESVSHALVDMHPCTRYVQVCRCTTLYALAMYTLTVAMSWVRCAARGMGSAHVPVGVNA